MPNIITSGGASGPAASISWGPEQNDTGVADDSSITGSIGRLLLSHQSLTLPATAPFWRISAIEWKNGPTINGTLKGICCIMARNTQSVDLQLACVAITDLITQVGANVIQKESVISSLILPQGTVLFGGIIENSNTQNTRFLSSAAQNSAKNGVGVGGLMTGGSDNTAWLSTGANMYIVLYFEPIVVT